MDAYGVLGVPPDVPQDELKAAHRRLVRRHHPDLVDETERAAATRRVQQINVAYGLVRDPASRAAYDRAVGGPAAGIEALTRAAGGWAGRWWLRNRAALRRSTGGVEPSRASGRLIGRLSRRAGWGERS